MTDRPEDALRGFGPATRAWFTAAFAGPTPAQAQAWEAIRRGDHTLVVAPTGSGKTLAAFLWALDRLSSAPPPEDPHRRLRVLYVSPMKALAVDVERNLRTPLAGIRAEARRSGMAEPDVTVGVRSGDTPPEDRRRFVRHPPDVLITTPESLFLLLTAQSREVLRGVETVIVDEVHAVAGSKRGAHLALSLERLDALLPRPAQRVGLSATVRPVDEVARFLGGAGPVSVVRPPSDTRVDLEVVVPVEDLGALGAPAATGGGHDLGDGGYAPAPAARPSVWPHVEARIVDLVATHRSTIVFANSRRLAERLCARLNETWQERVSGEALPPEGALAPAVVMASGATRGADSVIARAHHGSVSREQRARIEDDLKAGRLPAVVATSSLELGIDMGAVDLVVQVEPPPSVASGLQRVGRASHQVDGVSRGVVFPKHRGELLATAVVVERMRRGEIESLAVPRNPLDVLAQQVVAAVAMDTWDAEDLFVLVRRAAPFAGLPRSAYDGVLDMLSGRYPSDAFAELRPRIVWDRATGAVSGRPGAQRLAVTNPGAIPDRGLYGVHLVGERASRVGELDEEMVHESRVGDVISLGATSWRIEDITHDRVLVSPAPGQPGRLPFWHGDALGRPAELGRAVGAFTRELGRLGRTRAEARLRVAGLDEWAAANLLDHLDEQRAATRHVPDDRTIVVERFRDELGDWRVAVHSPYGARVHGPWALALAAGLRERYGVDVQAMHSDDGIVLRLPDSDELGELPDGARDGLAEVAVLDPDDVERLVTEQVGGSSLFAARFRECAGRALLLPRRHPGRRSPLWQQRQRSAQLLAVAAEYASFPIVLEAVREVLQDVYDVPALVALMREVAQGTVRVVEVETPSPSPFARTLLFSYVGAFLYEGDSPLAERRAQALALDASLLAELLGQAELRELLDADAVDAVERELQRLAPGRELRDAEDLADALRVLGPLDDDALRARGADPAWAVELERAHRVVRLRVAGRERWAAVEDVGRLRDALGVAPPPGVASAFLEPVADPLGDLVARFARTHGPFTEAEAADHLGLGVAVAAGALRRLAGTGRVVAGQFRPGGSGTEWCDAQVLRRLRRRSLAVLRREAEPVPPPALGRFLPAWQSVGGRLRGAEGVLQVVDQLQGAAVPASALESLVLPARVAGYRPAMLDELTASGEVLWAGHGALPGGDGWLALYASDDAPLLMPDPVAVDDALQRRLLSALDGGAALFFGALVERAADGADEPAVASALWELVWGGLVTNDTLAPLRARPGRQRVPQARYARRRVRPRPPRAPRAGGPREAGRWSRLPDRVPDPTARAHAVAGALLERHGVVTRGAVVAERLPGGFAAAYRVLAAYDEAGRARRGYFVEGLGAAQFGLAAAVDRLRAGPNGAAAPLAVLLAATDPANPYGAALPWPSRTEPGGHRPGRKAGAVVVLVGGELVLYVERGGRSLLTYADDDALLRPAADALALAVRDGALGRLTVERADGAAVTAGRPAVAEVLREAGFQPTPRGLRLRG